MAKHKYPILARLVIRDNEYVKTMINIKKWFNLYNYGMYYPTLIRTKDDKLKCIWSFGCSSKLDYDKLKIISACDWITIDYVLYYTPYIEYKIDLLKNLGFSILERGDYIVDDEGILGERSGELESEVQE